jgi:hypothetical protein
MPVWLDMWCQGGPVPGVSANSCCGGRCCGGMVAGGLVRPMKSRWVVSLYRVARLPPLAMMTRESSRYNGLLGTMPRSRQMSAMTAPTERRPTCAAMSAGVGRRARRVSAAPALRNAKREEQPFGGMLPDYGLRSGISVSTLELMRQFGLAGCSCPGCCHIHQFSISTQAQREQISASCWACMKA